MNLGLLAGLTLLTVTCMKSRVGGWVVIAGTTVVATVACIAFGAKLAAFTWIKMYTLVVSAGWLHAIRHHGWLSDKVAHWGMWFVLALNIVEAVVMDALQGHYVNAACGAALTLSLWSYRSMRVLDEPERHLAWALPVTWILAYTAWNFTFVAGKYGWHLSDHLIVLGLPLLWVFLRSDRWVEARAYSLTLYVLILITCVEGMRTAWPVNWLSDQVAYTSPPHDGLRFGLAVAAAVLTALHLAERARDVVRARA